MKHLGFIVVASLLGLAASRLWCAEPLHPSFRPDQSISGEDGEIRGRVVRGGLPVAGATVTVVAVNSDGGVWGCLPETQCGSDCAREDDLGLRSSVTAADGTFTISGPPLDGGTLLWVATSAGRGRLVDGAPGGDVEVESDAGMVVVGTVWLDGVRPPNGVVSIRAVHRELGASVDVAVLDGGFSIGPLPDGPYILIAAARGYAAGQEVVTPRSPRPVLHLLSKCSVRGTLAQGTRFAEGVSLLMERGSCVHQTKTGKNGEFAFEEILPGQYTLSAKAASAEVGTTRVIEVPVGCRVESLKLSLATSSVIAGRVVDERNRPIDNVEVAVGKGATRSTLTTTDGRFALHGWWSGAEEFSANAPGYLKLTRAVDGTKPNQDLEIRLQRAFRLGGVVTDERGAPVPATKISAREVATVRAEYSTASDTDGSFSLGSLPAGRYELIGTHNRFATSGSVVDVPGPEVTMRLGVGHSIDGLVTSATGSVPGASIRVTAQQGAETRWGEADALGEFAMTGLAAGRYRLTAFGRDREGSLDVVVPLAGGRKVSVVLSAVASIIGEAKDPDGDPVPDARVFAENLNGERLSALTDRYGRFSFKALASGAYRLSAWTPDRRTQDDVLVVAGGDVELVLVDLGRLSGRVVDRSGRPLRTFFVNGREFTESSGRFDIPSEAIAERGIRTVRVMANGYLPVEALVVVAPLESRDVGDIVVGIGRELNLRVVSEADGKPVSSAQIWSAFPTVTNDVKAPFAATGDDGFVHLVGLPERKAELWVHHPLHGTRRVELPDDVRELTVAIREGARLAVRVVDAESRPQAAKVVFANSAEPNQVITLNTDQAGRVLLDPISAGTWVVVGRSFQPPRRGSALVTVAEGGTLEVDLRLQAATKEVVMHVAMPDGWVVREVSVLPKGAALGELGEPDPALSFIGGWSATYVSPGTFQLEGAISGEFVAIVTAEDGVSEAWWQAPFSIFDDESPQRVAIPKPLPNSVHKH